MNLKTLLTLASAASLVAADGFYCPFAQDNSGMIQKPYCCDSFSDSPGTSPAKIGNSCQKMSGDYVDTCPKGGSVKCCYTIVVKLWVCVIWGKEGGLGWGRRDGKSHDAEKVVETGLGNWRAQFGGGVGGNYWIFDD
ncbi:hypothetical protein BO71DRAFT_442382 [Aspergillus ellipticus CBS 707.79]|uniref:Hydrophobin n=1 Tax=Aspergillus ellipticus CBS 707.79 TaxID=1448320 RepID=A0A319DML3_9EURO|nr:hypothetical protein BO71DRAFT_442382 [Aspergillus ellipticus CBS 707.79]